MGAKLLGAAGLRQDALSGKALPQRGAAEDLARFGKMFGDLEISTIRDAPPGRQPVKTYLADDAQRDKWWDFVRRKLREGRQARTPRYPS